MKEFQNRKKIFVCFVCICCTKFYQYINESLKHNLRPYQLSALFSLDWVQKHDEVQQHNHLMFNMATGSGKQM